MGVGEGVSARCGCGEVLVGAETILEHVQRFRHSIILRGSLSKETAAGAHVLEVLVTKGEFHAACGCGFTSSSLQKSLEHAAKGHTVNWILRLDRKASACRSRKSRLRPPQEGLLRG